MPLPVTSRIPRASACRQVDRVEARPERDDQTKVGQDVEFRGSEWLCPGGDDRTHVLAILHLDGEDAVRLDHGCMPQRRPQVRGHEHGEDALLRGHHPDAWDGCAHRPPAGADVG
jgi:hypothetical protein